MGKNLPIVLVDAFIIVMQVTYGMSMLKVWLLDPIGIPYYGLDIAILTILFYSIRFKSHFRLLAKNGFSLPKLLIVICLLDCMQLLFHTFAGFALLRVIFTVNIFFFMEYLVSLYYEYRSRNKNCLFKLTNPYVVYSVYNVFAVCVCAILLMAGVISSTDNILPESSLLRGNMELQTYFFPGHLSLALSSFRLLDYLGIPVLTGLSHEPHVLWWLVGPSLFLLLGRYKEKKGATLVFLIIFLLLSLLSTSFIALAVFASTLLLELFYYSFIEKQKKGFVLVIFISIIGFTIVFIKSDFLVDALSLMLDEKLGAGTDGGSMGYTVSSLSYLFSPRSLFGWGNVTNLGWGYDLKGADIGLATFFLDIVFFVSLYVTAFKLFLSKDADRHYIGLACLYFLFHSLKMGTQVFTFPYFAFIVVLLSISNNKERPRSVLVS